VQCLYFDPSFSLGFDIERTPLLGPFFVHCVLLCTRMSRPPVSVDFCCLFCSVLFFFLSCVKAFLSCACIPVPFFTARDKHPLPCLVPWEPCLQSDRLTFFLCSFQFVPRLPIPVQAAGAALYFSLSSDLLFLLFSPPAHCKCTPPPFFPFSSPLPLSYPPLRISFPFRHQSIQAGNWVLCLPPCFLPPCFFLVRGPSAYFVSPRPSPFHVFLRCTFDGFILNRWSPSVCSYFFFFLPFSPPSVPSTLCLQTRIFVF